MTEKKEKKDSELDFSGQMQIVKNEDGTIDVNGKRFASMEDFAGSFREHEEEIKGSDQK
jgi:hypothetical protein